MKAGKKILIAAHGNSLRGIVKHLDDMSNDAIMALNLPTGIPFVYKLDADMKPIESMKVTNSIHALYFQAALLQCYFVFLQFLGDPETVKKAMEAVAAQGKAKK